MTVVDFDMLREEMRGLDGDLYLCHLFAPADKRDALLTLYYCYADIARIPASVSEEMIGAIRLQWWRDLLDAAAKGYDRGAPIGAALTIFPAEHAKLLPLIDGREAALPEATRTGDELEAEAATVGAALMALACRILTDDDDGATDLSELLDTAGTGFELMRLVPQDGAAVAQRAAALLTAACQDFNCLPRKQRKKLLPAFLPIGLARRQAMAYPRQKSLLAYQFSLLKMALIGKV